VAFPKKQIVTSKAQLDEVLLNKYDGSFDISDVLLGPSIQNFPEQVALVKDPSQFIAVHCSRRSGKSMTVGMIALVTAFLYPNSNIVICGMTEHSIKNIFVKDILDVLIPLCPFTVHKRGQFPGYIQYDFPNGSRITFFGLDSYEEQGARILGIKARLIIIDEAQDFRTDLQNHVIKTFAPMLLDQDGKMIITGTPGPAKDYWWAICHNDQIKADDGIQWSVHHWTVFENPYNAEKAHKKVNAMLPRVRNSARVQREWFGKWRFDDELQIYKIRPAFEISYELEQRIREANGHVILGVDTGYKDHTAYVLVKHIDDDPRLFVLHAETVNGVDFAVVAARLNEFITEYSVDRIFMDAHPQTIATFRNHFGLGAWMDEDLMNKSHKSENQMMLSSQLDQGKIAFAGGGEMKPYARFDEEWKTLIWDQKKLDRGDGYQQVGKVPDHLSDALLYAWRNASHWSYTPKKEERKRTWEEERRLKKMNRHVEDKGADQEYLDHIWG
jgi:hypothetical protein